MFRFFNSPTRVFEKKYIAVQNSNDPGETLRLAKELLENIDDLQPWPRSLPPKRTVVADIHFETGRAYLGMLPTLTLDPYEAAISCYRQCIDTLSERDSRRLARAYYFLSVAYADRIQGDLGENTQKAIGHGRTSISFLDAEEDKALIATTQMTLAGLIADSPAGNIKENVEEALDLLKDADRLLDYQSQPDAWLMLKIRLAETLTKREIGTKRQNVDRALAELDGVRSYIDSRKNTRVKIDFLEAEFQAYLQRVSGSPERNFEQAIRLCEELLNILSALQDEEKQAGVFVSLGMAWVAATHIDLDKRTARACEFFSRALAFFDQVRFPEMHLRVEGMLKSAKAGALEVDSANLEDAIQHKEHQLSTIERDSNFVTWVDWTLDFCHLLLKDKSNTQKASANRAISQYRVLVEQLTPEGHVEHWSKAIRGLIRAIVIGESSRVPEMRQEVRFLLETLLENLRLHDEPLAWIEANIELAEFIRLDVNGYRQDNVEQSIALLEVAMVGAIGSDLNRGKAAVAYQLGNSFEKRQRGSQLDNLMEAVKYFHLARSIVEEFANDELSEQLELDIARVGSRIQSERDGPDGVPNEHFSGVDDHSKVDFSKRNRKGLEAVNELLRVAESLDRSANFDRWFDIMVRAAEQQMYVWKEDVADPEINTMTDGLAGSGKQAIEILKQVLKSTNKNERPAQWADVHWRIAGVSSMAYLWASFRSTAGRGKPQDPNEMLLSEESAHWFSREAIESLECYISIYPQNYSPTAFLTASMRLARWYMQVRKFDRAWELYLGAISAFETVSYTEQITKATHSNYVHILADIGALGSQSGLHCGQPLEAIALADASRFKALSYRIAEMAAPINADSRLEVENHRAEILQDERSLSDPWVFDRHLFISRITEKKAKIAQALAPARLSYPMLVSHLEGVISERPNSVFVFTHFSEFEGFISIAFTDNSVVQVDYEKVDFPFPLTNLFSEGLPGQVAEWQSDYLTGHLSREQSFDESWEVVLERTSEDLSEAVGKSLSELLSRNHLSDRDALHLNIIPNGPIGVFPLGLMNLRYDRQSCLLDDAVLSFLPNLSFLDHVSRNAIEEYKQSKIAIFYSMSDKSELPTLDFAELEARSIANGWLGQSVSVVETDKASMEDILAPLKSSEFWHFVCHGFFDAKDPKGSALLLGNGKKLSVGELLNLQMEFRPRLVMLSACSSGLFGIDHFPDEQVGLPGAFLAAGAEGVIASLWPINDIPASLLFSRVYHEMSAFSVEPNEALGRAQQWLKSLTLREVQVALEGWRNLSELSDSGRTRLETAISSLSLDKPELNLTPFREMRYPSRVQM